MPYASPTRRVIVMRPTGPFGDAFGHMILDVLHSMHLARARGALLVWLHAGHGGLTRLRPEGIRLVAPRGPVARLLHVAWNRFRRADVREDRAEQLRDYVDLRPSYCLRPIPVGFGARDERAAREQARAAGLLDKRIVTMPCRESGRWAGREGPTDTTRSVEVAAYYPAVDELVARGYTVVRIGDPSMAPIEREGLVDLATAPHRTDVLELWCVMRSAFLLASDSGPFLLSTLLGVPCLHTNSTNPVWCYPALPRNLYLCKRVLDTRSGEELGLRGLLSEDFLLRRKDTQRFEFLDNTPDELRTATLEMLAGLVGAPTPTRAQIAYRERLSELLRDERVARASGKSAQTPFHLGEGWAAPSFAATLLEIDAQAVVAT